LTNILVCRVIPGYWKVYSKVESVFPPTCVFVNSVLYDFYKKSSLCLPGQLSSFVLCKAVLHMFSGLFHVKFMVEKWHSIKNISQYFVYLLPATFHQYSIHSRNVIILLSEGQAGEVSKHSNKAMLSHISGRD
jgi:hypothetical protein